MYHLTVTHTLLAYYLWITGGLVAALLVVAIVCYNVKMTLMA